MDGPEDHLCPLNGKAGPGQILSTEMFFLKIDHDRKCEQNWAIHSTIGQNVLTPDPSRAR